MRYTTTFTSTSDQMLVPCSGTSMVVLDISGNWNGVITAALLDPEQNITVTTAIVGLTCVIVANITTNGQFIVPVNAPGFLKVKFSSLVSGTATIAAYAGGQATIGYTWGKLVSELPAGTQNIGDVDVLTLPAITGIVTANQGGVWTPQVRFGNKATYAGSTNGTVSTGTTAATVTSIAYLWHPAANTKRVQINAIRLSWAAGATGDFTLRLARITAENGTPGGTSQTINATDQADASSTLVLRSGATGAPTRASGDYITISCQAASSGFLTLTAADFPEGKPLTCRASTAEGWEIRSVVGAAVTTASKIAVDYFWTEE